ncbi:MAG: tetratricopeptide repeat protein [Thermoanaerobaculia bacterium]
MISRRRGLRATEGFVRSGKAIAPLWTTRGGALCDIGDLEEAEQCAKKAVDLDPNDYYPHNLLGAIYFELGDFEAGEKHFDFAAQLGSSSGAMEASVGMVQKRNADAAHRGAEYLLSIDRQRYRWANRFVVGG